MEWRNSDHSTSGRDHVEWRSSDGSTSDRTRPYTCRMTGEFCTSYQNDAKWRKITEQRTTGCLFEVLTAADASSTPSSQHLTVKCQYALCVWCSWMTGLLKAIIVYCCPTRQSDLFSLLPHPSVWLVIPAAAPPVSLTCFHRYKSRIYSSLSRWCGVIQLLSYNDRPALALLIDVIRNDVTQCKHSEHPLSHTFCLCFKMCQKTTQ